MPSQKTKFNTFEGFLVPERRTWVIELSDPSDGSGKASDLIVRGKYVARNATKKGGQLKAKPNKIASVWLYEGTIVEFTNQAVVDSARLEVYADTVKPPFKLPDTGSRPCSGGHDHNSHRLDGTRRHNGRHPRILGKRRRGIKASRDLTDLSSQQRVIIIRSASPSRTCLALTPDFKNI